MKKEEIQVLFSQFEQVSCILNDVECWSARDLCTLLGYKEWRNFTKAIEKAKNACSNVGHIITDHFVDVNKMVVLGSGAERQNVQAKDLQGESRISQEHIANNAVVRDMLVQHGMVPQDRPAAEDVKKVERRLAIENKKALENKGKKINAIELKKICSLCI